MNSTLSLINPSSINDSSWQLNVTKPSDALTFIYQSISGFIGLINLYLFMALTIYECFYSKKAKKGKKLRILCILTVLSSIFYEILQQFIIELSGKSMNHCLSIMIIRTTIQNMAFSFTYAFMWQRQLSLYNSKKFQDLRGTKMKFVTRLALTLIVVNPIIMLGFQFQDGLYMMKDGVCLVLNLSPKNFFPFIFVAFSYSFIQVTLVFLFFYPLYKRRFFKKSQHLPCQKCKKITCPNNNRATSMDIIASRQSEVPARSSIDSVLASKSTRKTVDGFKNKSLDKSLSKWFKLSLLCVASDYVSAIVIAVFLFVFTPSSFINPMLLWLDVDILISTFCLLGYFKNFKIMLFPFPKLIQQHFKTQHSKIQSNSDMMTATV